ncbi:MAG: alanine racemase, partial [Candidatus Omnitrophota bacterium]
TNLSLSKRMPNKKSLRSKIGYRPTWAEVDLSNLEHNFSQIKKIVLPDTRVMATVKADAYGHGLIPVTKKLISCGVDYLGVASIDEGIKLRDAGIKLPILILGMILREDMEALFRYSLTPTVCTQDLAEALNKTAAKKKRKVPVHIKVDTGMGRIGVMHYDAHCLVKKIYNLKNLNAEGLFTHFAFADMNKEFTDYQIDLFNKLVERLNSDNIRIPLVHAANSMGIISYKRGHFNMVRPGLVLYGLHPARNIKIDLKPVLSLKTKVVFSKKLPKGYGVSYGHDYVTKSATTLVTLPIGYGDGYPRNLSNIADVLISGKRFKICGKVCMDQIMVDVGNAKVKTGQEVVLIGRQAKQKVSTEELARLSGTIPYEIVCGLGSRIPRVYI